MRHLIGVLFVTVWVWDVDDAEPVPHNLTTIINQQNNLYPQEGIYPLLRDFQCGHENMQTPRVLRNSKDGRGRYVIDIGLDEGKETLDAVESGFVVFGFEMLSGSMNKIRDNAKKRGILGRVHFVEFEFDNELGLPIAANLNLPPDDGKGYAYIFNAGISDEVGSMHSIHSSNSVASITGNIQEKWSSDRVPILRLDQVLPPWVTSIFFLKIDTQGHELKVLHGALQYLTSNKIQYVQYEFSPKLMEKSNSGDPFELLLLLISMKAICFDMMGSHHVTTRPSKLKQYYDSIVSAKNSVHPAAKKDRYAR